MHDLLYFTLYVCICMLYFQQSRCFTRMCDVVKLRLSTSCLTIQSLFYAYKFSFMLHYMFVLFHKYF